MNTLTTFDDMIPAITAPVEDEVDDETADGRQLRLLDTSRLPLQHRLDMDTRRRGLAHVAEIRRLLADQAARRAA